MRTGNDLTVAAEHPTDMIPPFGHTRNMDGEDGAPDTKPGRATITPLKVVLGLIAAALGGAAADLFANNAATQWGWTAFGVVFVLAGLISTVWWLSGLHERSRGRRLATPLLITLALIALLATAVLRFTAPELVGWVMLAASVCIIAATLLISDTDHRLVAVFGVAMIGVGVAMFGFGVALILMGAAAWITDDTPSKVAMIGVEVAMIGVGVTSILMAWLGWTTDDTPFSVVAMIGVGVGVGGGVTAWIVGGTLFLVAMLGVGVAMIGVGVTFILMGAAAWTPDAPFFEVVIIGGGIALIGVEVVTWIEGRTLFGVAVIGLGVAVIGGGVTLIVFLGWALDAQEWPGKVHAWLSNTDDTDAPPSDEPDG